MSNLTTQLPLHGAACWRTHIRGFTMVELMTAIAVLGILAAIAVPSFRPIVERWQVRHTVEGLRSTLHFARSEAIRRGGNVTVQKLPNGGTCTGADGNLDWDCGWIVCHDTNDNGKCEATEIVLQRFDATRRTKVLRSGGTDSIRFNRWGMVAGAWPSFGIYPLDKTNADPAARRLCMSSGGRIRLAASATCS